MLQKRICRILTDSAYYAHSDPLFKQLKLLKLNDLFKFHCQIFMHKTMNLNYYPRYRQRIIALQSVHSYNTRNTTLKTPFCRSDFCKQSLLYQGIKAWNQLSDDLKNITPLKSIKRKCKEKIVNRY